MTGEQRIAGAFAAARAAGRSGVLIAQLVGGYPTPHGWRRIGAACLAQGADILNITVPHGTTLVELPAITVANRTALAAGASFGRVLELAGTLAAEAPVVLTLHVNALLTRGLERLVDELAEHGVCGLLVRQLPLGESEALLEASDRVGLALIRLVVPASSDARLARLAACARGYLYAVAETRDDGRGQPSAVPEGFAEVVARARAHAQAPVVLGGCIATADQVAAAIAAGADGVVVGSRLTRAISSARDPSAAVAHAVGELAGALHQRIPVGPAE